MGQVDRRVFGRGVGVGEFQSAPVPLASNET